MKEAFVFRVFPCRGDHFTVTKTISQRSLMRVMMNLMRKHDAYEVELVTTG